MALLGQMGFGTPTGGAGVVVDFDVVPVLTAEVGVGIGTLTRQYSSGRADESGPVEDANPLQLAAMLRLRAPLGREALSIGTGLSSGGYQAYANAPFFGITADYSEATLYIWDPARWWNIDVAFERRAPGGTEWRVFVGTGSLLNHERSTRCRSPNSDSCSWSGDPVRILYLGAALGYAFDLTGPRSSE